MTYKIYHLAKGCQRLAQHVKTGHYYLFDRSGDTPEHTDDGPLMILENRPVQIDREGCTVYVAVERLKETSRVMITHESALRLRKLIPALRFHISPELFPLWHLLAAAERDAAEEADAALLRELEGA